MTAAISSRSGAFYRPEKREPERMIRLLAAVVLAATVALPVRADDAAIIDAWYAALVKPDREKLSSLLAEDAVVRLEDLGMEQSRGDFISSMDEWETAVEGSQIRHRVEKDEGGVATVLACYDFPDNDILMRETFRIDGDRIVESTQVTVADNCDAY